ncbi:MAG: RagB/SusD family nutrient uptake outer membrane protein [Prevotella sp.]|nr:RagB/SusD family nutrient uptake outer membrane protein [Prevotella sp.]MBR1880679.1 RagB/SusD family nutrient uptake outer membrane protein [Prevotella sp.]
MKKINLYIAALLLSVFAVSCSVDDVKPQGKLDDATASSNPDKLVTAAYAMLGNDWYSYPFNLWPYGDMSADDCLKGGSGENDTGYHPMEIFSTLQPDRGEFDELWYRLYLAISRCNRALEAMSGAEETASIKQLKGETRFLRAHFYYKLQQMWYRVPFIKEGMSNADIEATPQSTHDEIMQLIIDDFQYAYENLAEANPGTTGRAHKVAAAAYLAKCYLNWAYGDGYEATTGYAHVDKAKIAKVLEYTKVVKDSPYDYLDTYGHIFLQDYANSVESVFAVQHSNKADDGTTYGRANWSNMLNGVWGIWSCGWDFHKPSQNLVNAFKTRNGLPMDNFDEDHNAIVINGADSKYKYDPRLFHTVGMPTYPYKYEEQYTLTKANSRTPNTYGYYCSMKEIPQRSKGEYYDNPWQAFGQNDYVLRYTDVMLMRAEALIENGDYNGEALQIINEIRSRAKKDISGTSLIKYAKDQCDISLYGNFASQDDARKALRWERRVELAMEGHRFFDLRRWGLLSTTLNKYFETEVTDEYDGQTYALYYKDAFFTKEKNEYFPIASNQMNYVQGLYKQNKGYN